MSLLYKKLINISFGLALIISPLCFISCSNDEPSDGPSGSKEAESTILVYAVATNSLSNNLTYDKNEMLKAAENIDLDKNNVLIFQTRYNYRPDGTPEGMVDLIRLSKADDEYKWEQVKEYSNEIASLNPQRVTEVIDYVANNYPAQNYGLIFWSHSTGSQPYFPVKNGSNSEETFVISMPSQASFGQDKTTIDSEYEQINVDKLADAIPDNLFDFIWFDSCYMGNIETIYQFRNKCKTYVGYPTEVLDDGLPYHVVLPYLTGKNPDIVTAAQNFFTYYAESGSSAYRIATISVVDMNNIEEFAQYCRKNVIAGEVNPDNFIKYTRLSTGPFYDLGDYVKALAALQDINITNEDWEEALKICVKYKAATPTDFNYKPIDQERYSGLSTHYYNFLDGIEYTEAEQYYQSLDWYQTLFN